MIDSHIVITIPDAERTEFDKIIKRIRQANIRKAKSVVETVFIEHPELKEMLLNDRNASGVIQTAREHAWENFLIEEAIFNTNVLRELSGALETPKTIMNALIETEIKDKDGKELFEAVQNVCGEYAGKIYPYIYALSLSNTNSRRSRAGSTFEAIIYQIYQYLGYHFDSQEKVGRKVFEQAGLGKKVDSVLPGIEEFRSRRDKTIIGTMKTSLRERWQEVAEEIERTKIPVIHLLTVDTDIAKNKAAEMGAHNIIVVALKNVIDEKGLGTLKNIISFEDYFFTEIPNIIKHWNKPV